MSLECMMRVPKGTTIFLLILYSVILTVLVETEGGPIVLQEQTPIYDGDSVSELMELCKNLDAKAFIADPNYSSRQCPAEDGEECIPKCDEDRVNRLRDAQTRVENMMYQLQDFHSIFWPIIMFFVVLLQGTYLIIVKQFNWRTLPFIKGYAFEINPTDGYRYRHYMWMHWVILDSEHPLYYRGMTPDTQELEYTPQIDQWEDPDADSEEEIHHAWSARDICDMTADPNDRLEIYFRRVQQKYQLNKPPRRPAGKYKKRKRR